MNGYSGFHEQVPGLFNMTLLNIRLACYHPQGILSIQFCMGYIHFPGSIYCQ